MRASGLCALLAVLLALTPAARGQEPPPPPEPAPEAGPPPEGPAPAPEAPAPAPAPPGTVEPGTVEPETVEPETVGPETVEPESLPEPTSPAPESPQPLTPEALPGSAEPPPAAEGGTTAPGGAPAPAPGGAGLEPRSGGIAPAGARAGGTTPPTGGPTEEGVLDPLRPTDLGLDGDGATLDPARAAAQPEAPARLLTDPEDTSRLRDAPPPPAGRSELSGLGSVADSFGLAPQAVSQRGWRLTPWLRVAPVIRAEAAYDSNVFRARSDDVQDEEGDVELVGSVGFTAVARPVRPLYLSLSYSLLYRTFGKDTDVNSLDHLLRLSGSWSTRRFNVAAFVSLADLSRPDDPRFGGAQAERLVLEGAFSGQVQLMRTFGLRAEEALQVTDYDSQDALDQLSARFNLLAVWQASRPLVLLAGIGLRDLRYTSSQAVNPDLRLFSPVVGAELRLATRLTLTLRLGYEFGQVTDDRGQADIDAPSGLVINAAAAWQIDPVWRLVGELDRQITTAISDSSQTNTRFSLEVRRRFGERLSAYVRGSVELQEPQGGDDDLLGFRAGCGLDWQLRDWVSVGTYASYQTSDSEQRGDFDVFRAGVVLTFTP